MKKIETPVIQFVQPVGTFFLGRICASKLEGAVKISRRSENADGQQRDLGRSRLKEISQYCEDPDATFPTAVILSVEESSTTKLTLSDGNLKIEFEDYFGVVIDGQHRLCGIWNSNCSDAFELPVVFMLNPTMEEKAYVFSIINSKQAKVNQSLIYDLFDVSELRSPQKTVHELARALNARLDSPFYNRLKMLGKATAEQKDATLSQGTFSKRILSLISKNPSKDSLAIKRNEPLEQDERLIFRKYFIEEHDEYILKIITNCFNALKDVFRSEWGDPKNNILWKTTGFSAIIDSLPKMFRYGMGKKDLSQEMFEEIFNLLAQKLSADNKELNSYNFRSGEQGMSDLREMIEKCVEEKER